MRQQPNFHRLDRQGTAAGRERPGDAPPAMPPLPPGWVCLQDCDLGGRFDRPLVVPFVLLHPDVGVALIDVAPASNPEAEAVLRRRLDAARFESIFPGHLPVTHLVLDRADLPSTAAILREAFAALPPLSVPGGDGWVSVVRRALLTRAAAAHHADPPAAGAGVPPPAEHAGRWRPARRADADESPAQGADTEPDMLHTETATPAAPTRPASHVPEPAARPVHPLPWIILSGVGGLIAALAIFGLVNTGADTQNAADEARPPAQPPVAAAPPPPPAASPAPLGTAAPTSAPAPAPAAVASAPRSPPTGPPPTGSPSAAPQQPAASPPPPAVAAAPPAPQPGAAASGAGASAAPAPAQRPAAPATAPATAAAPAADRLPRITVRQPANLRAAPDQQSTIIRVAPRGETFRVHGRAPNGWVQVGDTEPRGWLHTSRLGEVEQ